MAVIKFRNGAKAVGKGGKGARPPRKCFKREAEDHIAANCPARAARLAAEGKDATMGDGQGKGKGKSGGGKSKAKGKSKLGQPTKAAWNKQYPGPILRPKAMPTLAQWQQLHDAAWQPPTPGTKVLARAVTGAAGGTEDWTSWMRASGFAMCFRQGREG